MRVRACVHAHARTHTPINVTFVFALAEDDTSTNIRDLMPWVKSKLLTERKMSDRYIHCYGFLLVM